jgi:predicted nucleotidyltransferase
VNESQFEADVAGELAAPPGVLAVTLGGSRARGEHRPDSDWDFAIYYRGFFDPDTLRAKGWPGQVFDVGAWGGGVMNSGAWLTIDGHRVDVHYRDLEDVEHWTEEAQQGRFRKELLLFYTAGIPTYVVMAELACNRVVHGSLPVPEYPEALAQEAGRRWHDDAMASLGYGATALRHSGDVAVGLANAIRGVLEEAHSRMAAKKQWVLNEKGLVRSAGLLEEAELLLAAATATHLEEAITKLQSRFALNDS